MAVIRYLITLALVMFLPVPAFADITGQPRVIDGDTLEVAGERIRLYGSDAPEKDQSSSIDGRAWACGIAARGRFCAATSKRRRADGFSLLGAGG